MTSKTPRVSTDSYLLGKDGFGWAGCMPAACGLYNPEQERDACGVGFIVNIKGEKSHSILHDASFILCNMTHRGAEGADIRDGDGAGVMTGIPHAMLFDIVKIDYGIELPPAGRYAVGNIFFNPQPAIRQSAKQLFEEVASQYGLKVLCWRTVPVDNSIIGPQARSKEPFIEQPFVTMAGDFNERQFAVSLYLLRKHATHTASADSWFYICSLTPQTMVYKGRLSPSQVYQYFLDLCNPEFHTHFALVHSRFSTNTFPSWDRAQPMRFCAHNGEINTLRGNKNWTRSREGSMESVAFGEKIEKLFPIIEESGSDSSAFDNLLELLVINGELSLPESVMIMIPEAWQNNPAMDAERRAFYEWAACIQEPWDGPALITFSDGRYVGACLDRNGLRPCRYYVTKDDRMICASEVGTLDIPAETVSSKGRLQPGRMLLVDSESGCIVNDNELKQQTCRRFPFGDWIKQNMLHLCDLSSSTSSFSAITTIDPLPINEDPRMKAFGFTLEQLNMLLLPMIRDGKEALGSMGTDTPLACLSQQPRSLFDYFKQLFAQVTNPPIDPIRESIVMSLRTFIGPEGNLLELSASQCRRLCLPSPVLSLEELASITNMQQLHSDWQVACVDITFPKETGVAGYEKALDSVCRQVATLIDHDVRVVVLTDRAVSADRLPMSMLASIGAVHHHLIRNKKRGRVALIAETAEAREVHHLCLLLGYGADAICPYLAFEAILKLKRDNALDPETDAAKVIKNYRKACDDGILKVMSKMGISTMQSYKGAQIFEALGLDAAVVQKCFDGTASRIKGVGFDLLAADAFKLHEMAFPTQNALLIPAIPDVGELHWRAGGEKHINDPTSMALLQEAVRNKSENAYEKYSRQAFEQIKQCTLRGMLDFRADTKPIPLDEVEPWQAIVKRFCTGAMSYGSISYEAHSTLAIAMNRLQAKSNSGEGGEDASRSQRIPGTTDSMRSAIKQVASGRFGVTSYYLSDADDLQIKMAQGAKPAEGGELPGHKVSDSIAKTRKSTAGVGLISPPPHHDIYSIEDLKQLIFDLKCANPRARISVKLVSEVGVGVIAAGVAKADASHILISGHDGGTGASRWTGIKHAGLPWELGLAETHQTLVLNGLRGRVVLQTDGQIKTGRDVAVACLLGAEEWGFATTPLIAMGCIMMRKCHLNTCPVGIATQDEELRKKFKGQPEHVINFFYYVAQELRQIMARLGVRSVHEMVGRTDLLVVNESLRTEKTQNLDLRPILTPATSLRPGAATYHRADDVLTIADNSRGCGESCDKDDDDDLHHNHHGRMDQKFIELARDALEERRPVRIENIRLVNTDRTVGTTLSYQVSRRYGETGLPAGTIEIQAHGSAGQSFGAFLAPGITMRLEGDANDYVGKGLSGGRVILYPPQSSSFAAEQNIIAGNVCLYGATGGQAFFRGVVAERFCVRNSGADAVCEGVGDHGCEYMTGGRAVILGRCGRNFASGMSGGLAYIFDEAAQFSAQCNTDMVDLEQVEAGGREAESLRLLIEQHTELTGSAIGKRILDDWRQALSKFIKVFPRDLKRVMRAKQQLESQSTVSPSPALDKTVTDEFESAAHRNIGDIEDSIGVDGSGVDGKENYESPVASDKRWPDKVRGFMRYKRRTDKYRPPLDRLGDWEELSERLAPSELQVQAARCMDCGVPFCQSSTGCPIGNVIPKWNELVYKRQWKDALHRLLLTNNFPEFTGRVCPAPCESACVLGLTEKPVAIKSIECAIIDRGYAEGWIHPQPPLHRTGKRVAIVGSGPAGLAAADQLNKAGHSVVVYEREDRVGGLLMYGIPNMKLDKRLVDRRVRLMQDEGVEFRTNCTVGVDVEAREVYRQNDSVLLCTGASWPRDLPIPGRQLNGIHFAMDFLRKNTKSLLDSALKDGEYISAKGKRVVVIGGGDTGCDCIGTAIRHGAKSIVNFELMPQPPNERAPDNAWPAYARIHKVDYGHGEVMAAHGKDPRKYCVLSKEFLASEQDDKSVTGIRTVQVEWTRQLETGAWKMQEVPGSEEVIEADLILLAMGFLGPESKLLEQLGVAVDARRNTIVTASSGMHQYATSLEGVFAAGDCRRGQSLVVWGINEGRQAAREIDAYLTGSTLLPASGGLVSGSDGLPVVRDNLIQVK